MKNGYLLLTFLLVLVSLSISAQGWERIYGPENTLGRGRNILPTDDGNYILQGYKDGELPNVAGPFLKKVDKQGETIWTWIGVVNTAEVTSAHKMTNDRYLLSWDKPISVPTGVGYSLARLSMFDTDGNELWQKVIGSTNPDSNMVIPSILPLDNGHFVFFGAMYIEATGETDFLMGEMNTDGGLIWEKEIDFLPKNSILIGESSNGGYFIIKENNSFIAKYEVDGTGNLLQTQQIPWTEDVEGVIALDNDEMVVISSSAPSVISQTRFDNQNSIVYQRPIWSFKETVINKVERFDDKILITGNSSESAVFWEKEDGLIIETDLDGDVVLSKRYPHRIGRMNLWHTIPSHTGGYISSGGYAARIDGGAPLAYIFSTNENMDIYTNVISGTVALDENLDCLIDTDEPGFEDWIIEANKATQSFPIFTNSDVNGHFVLPIDTGDYVISVLPPSVYWGSCNNNQPISFPDFYNNATIDFPIDATIECPDMTIEVEALRIRPCFTRPVYVEYCNNGTVTAEDAYIEITIDSLLSPSIGNLPWTSISLDSTTLVWELGDVPPLECSKFSFNVFLDCDADPELAYCFESHIYPDSICVPTSALWSGAFLEVEGECEDSIVSFRIINTGDDPMLETSDYIIVEDAVLLMQSESDLLIPGEEETSSFPANGSTYTIMAEQVPNAPGTSRPIAIVAGCGENGSGGVSTNFNNQFPLDDFNSFIDIDCVVPVNSCDPNDKQGFPIGFQDEHYIEQETPIDYFIRFQNLGTDTAYTVIIKDTLDLSLNLATFRKGIGSHDYTMDISGQGILRFTFNNIDLPHQAVDDEGSNGFITFKITPHRDTPIGTIVENNAAIYFDYNAPIFTNTTFHTIGQDFTEIIITNTEHPVLTNISVSVYPNPFLESATFEIKGHQADRYQLEVYDVSGKVIHAETFNQSTFEFKNNHLNKGLYFYRITAVDGFLNTGKVVVK